MALDCGPKANDATEYARAASIIWRSKFAETFLAPEFIFELTGWLNRQE